MDRISKTTAKYTPQSTKPEHCATCGMFHPQDHRCDLVRGVIAPAGWCEHWIKKEK